MSHTSAHTFLDNIFQNSKSHVFMNVEIFGKRESSDACRSLGEFTFSGTGSDMNTSLTMSVRKPARKQESHCTRRLR